MNLWEKYNLPPPISEASKGKLSCVENEIYSGIEIPDLPVFVRLDGWKFHGLTRKLKLELPYDRFFATCLVETSKTFFKIFNPSLAYIFSDEINLLFMKTPGWKRIEKIDSVFAGIASTSFMEKISEKHDVSFCSFDCRIIPVEYKNIIDYLIWRQAECFRNHNNAYAYHVLRKKYSGRTATKMLKGKGTKELKEIALKGKISLNKTPSWQRNGIMVYKESYIKDGYNPIKREKVRVKRYRVKEDWEIGVFNKKSWKDFIEKILEE